MPRMHYMNATQAAIELGRNEKTVRRWITEGKLHAERPTPRKLAIPESEIKRVKLELEQLEQYEGTPVSESNTPDVSDLLERIEQLEQDRMTLSGRIEQLEQKVTALATIEQSSLSNGASRDTPEPTDATKPMRTHTPTEPRQKRLTELPTDLPSDAMPIKDFAELHGLKPRTFRDYFTLGIKGEIITDVIETPGRIESETKRYLTPEQQTKALDYLTRHNVRFTLPEQEVREQ